MDPDLQKRIDEAKAQGFTDAEIQQALQGGTDNSTQPSATMPGGYDVPILSAEEKARFNQSQQAVEADNTSQNWDTGIVAAGLGAAGVGVPVLAYKGAKAILSPAARGAADLAQRGVLAAEQANATAAATEARIAANQAAKAAAAAPKPVAPSPLLDQFGRPMAPSVQPVAPTAAPVAQGAQMAEQAAARAPSLLDKTTSMIRQLAASKVMQNLGKGMTGLQLATYSPELGPPVPQVGRMRGMEINPMTGRPWTPEQLKAYNANPAMYDSALGAAQMPR